SSGRRSRRASRDARSRPPPGNLTGPPDDIPVSPVPQGLRPCAALTPDPRFDQWSRGVRMIRISSVFASSLILIASIAAALAAAPPPSERQLAALLSPHPDIEAIRALGPGILPALAGLYERSDETRRT